MHVYSVRRSGAESLSSVGAQYADPAILTKSLLSEGRRILRVLTLRFLIGQIVPGGAPVQIGLGLPRMHGENGI